MAPCVLDVCREAYVGMNTASALSVLLLPAGFALGWVVRGLVDRSVKDIEEGDER